MPPKYGPSCKECGKTLPNAQKMEKHMASKHPKRLPLGERGGEGVHPKRNIDLDPNDPKDRGPGKYKAPPLAKLGTSTFQFKKPKIDLSLDIVPKNVRPILFEAVETRGDEGYATQPDEESEIFPDSPRYEGSKWDRGDDEDDEDTEREDSGEESLFPYRRHQAFKKDNGMRVYLFEPTYSGKNPATKRKYWPPKVRPKSLFHHDLLLYQEFIVVTSKI